MKEATTNASLYERAVFVPCAMCLPLFLASCSLSSHCLFHSFTISLLLSFSPSTASPVPRVGRPRPWPAPLTAADARPGQGHTKEARRAAQIRLFLTSSFSSLNASFPPSPTYFNGVFSPLSFLPPCDAVSDLWQGQARHPCFPQDQPIATTDLQTEGEERTCALR